MEPISNLHLNLTTPLTNYPGHPQLGQRRRQEVGGRGRQLDLHRRTAEDHHRHPPRRRHQGLPGEIDVLFSAAVSFTSNSLTLLFIHSVAMFCCG